MPEQSPKIVVEVTYAGVALKATPKTSEERAEIEAFVKGVAHEIAMLGLAARAWGLNR